MCIIIGNVCNLLYDIDVSLNAAQLLVSMYVHATQPILICVSLVVFDIMKHNKPAVVHLQCCIL